MSYDVYTLDFEVLSRLARKNIFDLYRRPQYYVVVTSETFTGSELLRQFEDEPYGYLQAYMWMKWIAGGEWEE
jgi:hypothetical protein